MPQFNLTSQLIISGVTFKNPGQIQRQLNGITAGLGRPIKQKVELEGTAATTRDIGLLVNSVAGLERELRALGKEQISYQATTKATSAATKDALNNVQDFGDKAGLAVRRFAAFSIATTAIFGTVAAIGGAIKSAVSFERELLKVQQVTRTTGTQIGGLRKEIGSLSVQFAADADELVAAAKIFSQAGFSLEETKKAVAAVAATSLSPSFDSITDTAEGSLAALQQFEIGVDDLKTALDLINITSAKYAIESSDLIKATQRAGGVFAIASRGVSSGTRALAEFNALITTVRSTTRESAEVIGTGLRTAFSRLQRPETVQYFKTLGVELRDLNGAFVGPFEGFKRIAQALENVDGRSEIFAEVIKQLGDVRNAGRIIPIITNFTQVTDVLNEQLENTDSVSKDTKIAQGNLAVELERTRQAFLAFGRDIVGSSAFQSIVLGATQVSRALIEIIDNFSDIIPLLATFGALKIGSGFIRGNGLTAFNNRLTGRDRSAPKGGVFTNSVIGLSTGGLVPGTGRGDKIPAVLEPDEFVVRRDVAVKNRGFLERLNSGKPIVFAKTGGNIGDPEFRSVAEDFVKEGTKLNIPLPQLVNIINSLVKSGASLDTAFNTYRSALEQQEKLIEQQTKRESQARSAEESAKSKKSESRKADRDRQRGLQEVSNTQVVAANLRGGGGSGGGGITVSPEVINRAKQRDYINSLSAPASTTVPGPLAGGGTSSGSLSIQQIDKLTQSDVDKFLKTADAFNANLTKGNLNAINAKTQGLSRKEALAYLQKLIAKYSKNAPGVRPAVATSGSDLSSFYDDSRETDRAINRSAPSNVGVVRRGSVTGGQNKVVTYQGNQRGPSPIPTDPAAVRRQARVDASKQTSSFVLDEPDSISGKLTKKQRKELARQEVARRARNADPSVIPFEATKSTAGNINTGGFSEANLARVKADGDKRREDLERNKNLKFNGDSSSRKLSIEELKGIKDTTVSGRLGSFYDRKKNDLVNSKTGQFIARNGGRFAAGVLQKIPRLSGLGLGQNSAIGASIAGAALSQRSDTASQVAGGALSSGGLVASLGGGPVTAAFAAVAGGAIALERSFTEAEAKIKAIEFERIGKGIAGVARQIESDSGEGQTRAIIEGGFLLQDFKANQERSTGSLAGGFVRGARSINANIPGLDELGRDSFGKFFSGQPIGKSLRPDALASFEREQNILSTSATDEENRNLALPEFFTGVNKDALRSQIVDRANREQAGTRAEAAKPIADAAKRAIEAELSKTGNSGAKIDPALLRAAVSDRKDIQLGGSRSLEAFEGEKLVESMRKRIVAEQAAKEASIEFGQAMSIISESAQNASNILNLFDQELALGSNLTNNTAARASGNFSEATGTQLNKFSNASLLDRDGFKSAFANLEKTVGPIGEEAKKLVTSQATFRDLGDTIRNSTTSSSFLGTGSGKNLSRQINNQLDGGKLSALPEFLKKQVSDNIRSGNITDEDAESFAKTGDLGSVIGKLAPNIEQVTKTFERLQDASNKLQDSLITASNTRAGLLDQFSGLDQQSASSDSGLIDFVLGAAGKTRSVSSSIASENRAIGSLTTGGATDAKTIGGNIEKLNAERDKILKSGVDSPENSRKLSEITSALNGNSQGLKLLGTSVVGLTAINNRLAEIESQRLQAQANFKNAAFASVEEVGKNVDAVRAFSQFERTGSLEGLSIADVERGADIKKNSFQTDVEQKQFETSFLGQFSKALPLSQSVREDLDKRNVFTNQGKDAKSEELKALGGQGFKNQQEAINQQRDLLSKNIETFDTQVTEVFLKGVERLKEAAKPFENIPETINHKIEHSPIQINWNGAEVLSGLGPLIGGAVASLIGKSIGQIAGGQPTQGSGTSIPGKKPKATVA